MKKYLLIIIMTLPFGAFPQQGINIDGPSYPIPEKRAFDHPPFSEDLDADYYLKEKYDKFKGFTSISLRLRITSGVNELKIGALFTYRGQEVQTPSRVLLNFTSKSEDWEYLRSSKLIFLADGERIDIGKMKRQSSVGRGYVLEFLRKKIPLDVFLEIVNADKVEGQLFTTEFELSYQQLEALRDFASRMK